MLVASACGQYPNVHQRAEAQTRLAGAQRSPTPNVSGTAPTAPGVPAGSPTPSEASGEGTVTVPGETPGLVPTTGAASTESPRSLVPSAKAAPGADIDRGANTGGSAIWGRTIVIGIHAPITGTHLIPFAAEKGLYWRFGNDLRPVRIGGRRVRVVVRDDRNERSRARHVCQQLVTRDHAFLLLGATGPEQAVACAHYAQSAGVPYLSLGTTGRRLAGLGNYFALSESYAQQASPVASYVKRTYTRDCGRVLMIAERGSDLDDAVRAFRRACRGVHVRRVRANEVGTSYGSVLCSGTAPSYRAVYPLTSQAFFLQLARAARPCDPRYVGVGVTMGLDALADTFCAEGGRTNHLRFLSPAPAFADSQRFDPGFERAAESAGVLPDDIGWLLWGTNQAVHLLLEQTGSDLSRHAFIRTAANASVNVNGFGRLQFSPSNHFGGRAFSLLTNVCSGGGGHYETLRADLSGF
jgi:ABC-type branched-subunit amino acid transport system substrate-binding protein